MAPSDLVTVDVADGIAIVTIDRPPVNALSAAAFEALGRAADRISTDDSVKVAVLTGTGRTFCAGADVKELAGHGPAERAAYFELTGATRQKVREIPVPVIAAINGPAAGAGVAYASFCDYRIAADTAFLAMPEINLGSVAAGGLPLMAIGVPSGALRYLLFSGRRVTAQEALAMHLVDEVVPAADLISVARERAVLIADKDRRALVAMKRAIGEMAGDAGGDETAYARTSQMTIALIDPAPGAH
jgi:enoyl-CoA hydratase/carnithine racemase